mmetsp:Transcript_4458/g.6168  ORF Transcript_4458/g.6168 Transcript_4458/m.6168 type:complete len:204 (-) Transcript_4458:925-1536(-)
MKLANKSIMVRCPSSMALFTMSLSWPSVRTTSTTRFIMAPAPSTAKIKRRQLIPPRMGPIRTRTDIMEVDARATPEANRRPYLTGTVRTRCNRSSSVSLMSIMISRPRKPKKSMETHLIKDAGRVATCIIAFGLITVAPLCNAIAADPLVSGAKAIRQAQTTFFNHVIGFRCFVYQKVSIKPTTTDMRAGIPGTITAPNKVTA